jgi:D-lactate dehydrogenase (cytochrome)
MISVDPNDPEEIRTVRAFNSRLVDRAIALDGTCTGEHGIGLGKQDKLLAELGAGPVDLMRQLKRTMDPDGILNPGKIFAA